MKSLLALAFLLLSTVSFAKSDVRLIKTDAQKSVIVVANAEQIIISKKEFKSAAEAKNFCAQMKSSLDTDFTVFGLVMVAGKELESIISNAGGFQFGSQEDGFGGLWQWSGNGNKVIMIQNGHGTDTEVVDASELNKSISTYLKTSFSLTLPAVCIKKLRR